MEATEEAEPSDHAISPRDGAKTSQSGQSWRSEGTVGPLEDPPADMGSQVLASRSKCHVQLRQKKSTQSAPPPESETSDAPQRKEQKSIKAGKYVCQYCGRACAKPSVLKKHIRSHTGERPYPCVPCGFSFKTKSNLYKHRKSHAHAVKAGLASLSGRGEKQENVGEMHSDAGQSSESDEDVLEEATESQTTASGRNGKPSHKPETTSPGKVSLWQFRERLPPVASAHVDQMIEFSTVKQRLALRLSEKKSHESEASLSLPGSYSKSSTDSGYFSRSDSAEQQLHPANPSAKSYQEIMFGKCYRPTASAKKSITVQSCTTDSSDSTSSFTIKPSKSDADRHGLRKDLVTSGKAQSAQEDDQQHLLEASDGVFLRSNSLPTSTSLDAAQALRSTHSFDERTTAADASCRGAAGMRRLRRQAAFEHCANECDCHTPLTCSLKSDSLLLSGDDSRMTAESHHDLDPCALSLWPDSSTRKRRKDKAGTDEEDLQTSSRSSETAVEAACSEAERREGRNVISVIQHTNSLSSSRTSPDVRSCTAESELWRIDAGLKFPKHLFSQPSITVPEIRVTVEPDRPRKLLDVAVEPKDKHVEEFQWPQRSQTLSQFPVEKLPPKKKRLRLAEMEGSSGESSFESACTSLSRSPSQDSNLSHGSGFSQSQERDETQNVTSQTEEASKPLELLSVPGCSPGVHREMRRSASEQAPHKTTPEVAGLRSKSVDLGSLSASWPGDIAERRKVFLIRQATLSESATPDTFSPGETMMKRTASHVLFSVDAAVEKNTLSLLDDPFHQLNPLAQGPEQVPIPKADAHPDLDHVRRLLAKEPAEFRSVKPLVSLSGPRGDCSPSVARVLSAIAQQASVAQASAGVLVPVRIQMQVPLYGNITYTSISHILESQTRTEQDTPGQGPAGGAAHTPAESPAKLKTGFPLSLTSKTISTTEAPSGGASKRMLSPASSLELVSKQQKRIKEENIYGQIVKELSAVELGNPEDESPQTSLTLERPSDVPYLPGEVEMDEVVPDSFTNSLRSGPGGDAAMEPAPDDPTSRPRSAPSTVPSVKAAGALFFSKLPGLHTSAHVSWCFLSCPKPNSWQTSAGFSEYSSWLVKSHNPNPLDLSTATVLALLRSKQAKQSLVYSVASMCQPGLLVTSIPERRKQGHVALEYNEEDPKRDARLKETSQRGKSSREDVSSAARQQEQARVKICEGGYKSSEEYVYVRGRGRGKYICEECGIRCKKPSMLKKHIRTHTDVRPYVCKCCNFAFKTKGNLTKHMKSKAHVKKCLELGVEQTEEADENQKTLSVVGTSSKHQFSDVEDSDGADEDGDEPDDDEDEEDDGDSTPKTLSRSTSPQPGGASRSCLSGLSEALTTRRTPGGPSSTCEDDLERWSASVEPCPPHLLSPRRDSPGQQYICPRADQPPLLLPSPRGDSSPTRQPSPSPPGHQRCLLRAVSPRRASCQHKTPGDQRRSVRVHPATPGDRRPQDPGDQSTSAKSDIFSHLPLHSQGQVPTTVPVMPIGGLRMPSTSPSAHEETARPRPPADLDRRDKEGLYFCEQAIASLSITSGEAAGSPQKS